MIKGSFRIKMVVFGLFMVNMVWAQPREKGIGATSKGIIAISDATQFYNFIKVVPNIGTAARDALMEHSLKSYMMPPRKMADNNASACYALAGCLEYYVNLNKNYKDNLSPSYIKYNLSSQTLEEATQFLNMTGTVSAAIMPFEATAVANATVSAQKYRIRHYVHLFQPLTRFEQRVYDTKKAITRGNPVIIELGITEGFKQLRAARFWDPTTDTTPEAGTQYVVVVGYDEDRAAFEILNFSGIEWGNGGYMWLKYTDFAKKAQNGYVLIPFEGQ